MTTMIHNATTANIPTMAQAIAIKIADAIKNVRSLVADGWTRQAALAEVFSQSTLGRGSRSQVEEGSR